MPPPHRPYSLPTPEEYFRGVSPLCRRILEDMTRVQKEYGAKWEELSYEEQCRILDQTIVDEATVRRYETADMVGPDYEYFPKLKISTGQKIVSDEKLSARGYTCSWRDEHSAPFSWHTRSQMDLTLESPPEALVLNRSTDITPIDGNMEINKHLRDTNCNTSECTYAAKPPFFWHYTPQPDLRPPDPPDLVLASLSNSGSSPYINKNMQFNHVVVRAPDEKGRSLLGWVRGALSSITGTCIPIHPCNDSERRTLHPSSPFIHPELRPPHVIAKGAKISSFTVVQPKRKKTESEESIFRLSKDATIKSECASTETTFTNDFTSDKGSSVPSEFEGGSKRDSQNLSRSLLSNRNSLMYGTFTEENLEEEEISHDKMFTSFSTTTNSLNDSYPRNKSLSASKYNSLSKEDSMSENISISDLSSFRNETSAINGSDEDLPLINLSTNNQNLIPKTGFDFLDNW